MTEEVSRLTGEREETAVAVALQERGARRRAEIDRLVRELNALFKEQPEAIVDHGDLLYGVDGLPK